jgi:hypothetical protein
MIFSRSLASLHPPIIYRNYALPTRTDNQFGHWEEQLMARFFRLIPCWFCIALLASCGLLPASVTPAITQRAQSLCDAAVKSGKIQDCLATPFNVDSAPLKISDATKQPGAVAAWCAQYDYSQLDKTNLWTIAHDDVLITQSQDLSYTFTPIKSLPPEGCAGYKAP